MWLKTVKDYYKEDIKNGMKQKREQDDALSRKKTRFEMVGIKTSRK